MRVNVGDQVAQGARFGLQGNSGDTCGPHVHYRLQRGPRWEYADGLPATFSNVAQVMHGRYFSTEAWPEAKPKHWIAPAQA